MKSKEEVVFDYYEKNPSDLFWRAYEFSDKIHRKHLRQDGSPYLVHPVELVYLSHRLGIRNPQIDATKMCHDTVEEAKSQDGITISYNEIANAVNEQTAKEVMILTKNEDLDLREMVKYFRRIFEEVHLGFIKTIDRYSNMRRSMFGRYDERRMNKYVYENQTYILPETHRIINFAEAPFDFKGKETYVYFADAFRFLRGAIKGIQRGIDYNIKLMRIEKEYEALKSQMADLKKENALLKMK